MINSTVKVAPGFSFALLAPLLILAPLAPVAAQGGAIVQPTPSSAAVTRLNQNLSRLSRQPTDMEALIGAGMAAYELGDAQAANGFFTRANMVNARDGRAKLGLALVTLALKQPRDAAAYFDEAEALGVSADQYRTERALAYDLTGQQDKAQLDYAAALRADPANSELIRAYAVSLGISGKLDLAEQQLRPLLYKSDRGAWRDRTMILAMNGRTAEARRIAQTIMPRNLSDALDPYLLRMGALTPAQKAAAVRYGQFPADGLRLATVTTPPPVAQGTRADTTSRRPTTRDRRKGLAAPVQPAAPADDSTLLAAMPHGDAPPAMVQPVPGQTLAAATPSPAPASRARRAEEDDPDGWTTAERQQAERRARAVAAQPVKPATPASTIQPTRTAETATSIRTGPVPTYASTAARAQSTVQPSPAQSAPPQTMAAATAGPPVQAMQGPTPGGATVNGPSFVPQPVPSAQPAPASSSPPSAPQPGFSAAPVEGAARPAARQRTLAEIMAGIEVPESEKVAPPQLVDLNEVAQLQATRRKAAADKAKADAAVKAKAEAAAKAKAEAAAKAKAEAEEKARLKANPARVWVQIATGKDPAALAFDMRRLRKTYSVLAGEDAFTAEWGATRRLLVGPFATQAKAKALLGDLKKAGNDGFVYQSEAGEVVTALSGK